MIPINRGMQEQVFKTQEFYLQALEDILSCLVQTENYEKAAEVRDLITYEKIEDPEIKESYLEELVTKYTMK